MSASARQLARWSHTVDERADACFEPYRGGAHAQRVVYAASLLTEAVLLGWGGATVVADSPRAHVARRRVSSVGAAALLTAVTKRVVGRRRPFAAPQRPVEVEPDTTSFPSGHTLWAVVAATWLAEGRWPAWVAYPAAAFVGVSRVHMRLHRASDVLAAALIGGVAWAVGRCGGHQRDHVG